MMLNVFRLFKATNTPGGPGLVEHGGFQSQGSLKVICGSPHLKKPRYGRA